MHETDKFAKSLQPHYSKFNVANRLLFTGHSHQAWPDVAFDGVNKYMQLAAEDVDLKWEKAFEKTEILRNYLRTYYDDPDGLYCREQNTHVLLVSWLSSLDLKNKPKILTTDGEFHSLYRQLHRLEEEGLTILRLNHQPSDRLYDEIKSNLDHKTSAVMLSRVYFESARINTKLKEIAELCRDYEVPLMIDDYHGTNVVPLSIRESGLEECYLMIGGYKYLQWGEANCFLRFPQDCRFRPVVTGWFSSFQTLDKPRNYGPVSFDEGDQRFATGTYDPVSQFRAAAVVRFFKEQELTPELLSNQYRAQVAYLRDLFSSLDIDKNQIRLTHEDPINQTGGFLSLTSEHARELRKMLLDLGIFTDARDRILRIGPAPYTTKSQCKQVIEALEACLKKIE
jgi:kynureninase